MRSHERESDGATLLLTIGSGYVRGSLRVGDEECWDRTVPLPLRNAVSFAESTKDVKKVVKEVVTDAAVAGRRALSAHAPETTVHRVQIEISAPWAVTVARTARVRHTAEFAVTPEILAHLERRAIQGAVEATTTDQHGKLPELELIESETIGLLINGYPARPGHAAHGETVSLTQLMSFAYREVKLCLDEAVCGAFAKATVSYTSSMGHTYAGLSSMPGHHHDVCIVLVGGEVTELGIVRDGVLQSASYTPYGIRTLARELRDNCGMTIATALSFMGSDTLTYESTKESIDEVLSLYETNLIELFERNGDPFFMPQAFYIVSDEGMASFFRERVANAVLHATKRSPSIFSAPMNALV